MGGRQRRRVACKELSDVKAQGPQPVFRKADKLGQHFKVQTGLNQGTAQGQHCYGCWKHMPRTAGLGSGCLATHSLTSCLVFQIGKDLSCKWQKCQSYTGLGIKGIVWAHSAGKIRSSDSFRVQRNSSRLSIIPSLVSAFYSGFMVAWWR